MATDTRSPTSDDAVAGTWTGSAGSRWSVVDDYPDTTGADELTHGTAAGNLTFGFSAFSLPANATGITVFVDYYDYKNGSQSCGIGGRIKVGGTYFSVATHNPGNGSGNRTQRTDTWATNPKTGVAWTVNDVNGVGANALQAFGWISADASPTISLSSIQLRVTYTAPTLYQQNVAGDSTNSGTVTPQLTARRALGGTSANSGAVSTVLIPGGTNYQQSVTGNSANSGAVNLRLAARRTLGGTSANSGAVNVVLIPAPELFRQSVGGTSTNSGTVIAVLRPPQTGGPCLPMRFLQPRTE